MGQIGDILAKRQFSEPDEIKIIKKFVSDNFKSSVAVTIHPKTIVISCPTSALAGTLRLHLHELAELCQTDKKLIIRIS